MRMPRLNLSARQTIALSIFGTFVASAGFILPLPHRNAHISGWLLASTFALIVAGLVISFYASTDLESGLLNERWPEAEVTSTRALLNSSFFTAAILLSLLACIVLLWVSRATRQAGWSLLIFGQSLSRLAAAAKPPRPSSSASRLTPDWNTFSPIHSDH
jgi:Fe2+ transport system protein B